MAAFKPTYIAWRALKFVDLVIACKDEGFPQYILFRTLGLCLSLAEPPNEDCLQVIWFVIGAYDDFIFFYTFSYFYFWPFSDTEFSVARGYCFEKSSSIYFLCGSLGAVCRETFPSEYPKFWSI